MREVLAAVSAILILVAVPPYIADTIRGKTRPERVTWLIFSVLGIIAFASQVGLGASWSLVFSGLDTFASILTFFLSLKYGVGGHTKLDVSALAVALVGAVTAIVAKQPIISLLGVIIADMSGMVLTIKKAFISPESETAISWLLAGTASLCGVLSVNKLVFGILLYPAYLMAANYAVPVAQFFGLRFHRAKNIKESST